MDSVISSILLFVIGGGIGYLVAQWRPEWFGEQWRRSLFTIGWIVALLLAGALRAAAVVYGPAAMFFVISLVLGFGMGVWLARRYVMRS